MKEIKNINGLYELKGLYDIREKEIEEQLENMAGKQSKQQSNTISQIINLRYINTEIILLPDRIFTIVQTKLLPSRNINYHNPYLSISNPPPESV